MEPFRELLPASPVSSGHTHTHDSHASRPAPGWSAPRCHQKRCPGAQSPGHLSTDAESDDQGQGACALTQEAPKQRARPTQQPSSGSSQPQGHLAMMSPMSQIRLRLTECPRGLRAGARVSSVTSRRGQDCELKISR